MKILLHRMCWILSGVLFFASFDVTFGQYPPLPNWESANQPSYPSTPYDSTPQDTLQNDGSPEPVYFESSFVEQPEGNRIADLEKKLNALEKEVKANAPKKPVPGEWEDMSQDKWTVKLGGHVQLDYINWAQASPAITGDTNYLSFAACDSSPTGTGYGVYRLPAADDARTGNGRRQPSRES